MTKETLIIIRRHLIGALKNIDKAITEKIKNNNNKNVKIIDK